MDDRERATSSWGSTSRFSTGARQKIHQKESQFRSLRYNQSLHVLIDLVQAHVDKANEVFVRDVFTQDQGLQDVYFRIKHMEVTMKVSCT